jgi:hypothetical protein
MIGRLEWGLTVMAKNLLLPKMGPNAKQLKQCPKIP